MKGPSERGRQSDPDSAATSPSERAAHHVLCPFCGSADTELLSPFASQLSTSQCVCLTCHSPFEYFRDEANPMRGLEEG